MARSSQTEAAVLGGLSVQPMTAYALREAIRDVLGHFWSESFGQIYPTLATLEEAGHVVREDGARSRSSRFVITASGRSRLRELLSEPVQQPPPRNGLLLRLFFGRTLGPEQCRALLHRAREDALRQIGDYEQLLAQPDEDPDTAADWPYIRLTVLAGLHAARATLAWADEALTELAALPPEAMTTVRDQP